MAIVACSDCGARQRLPRLTPGTKASCRRCGRLLDRATGFGMGLMAAWAVAILLLLVPANLLPIMAATLRGTTREVHVWSAMGALWSDGWPMLALMLAAFVMVLPVVWAGLMSVVLLALRAGWRTPSLGRLLRWAQAVRLWSMPDVLFVAAIIIFLRSERQLEAQVLWGGWSLLGAGVLALCMPLVLDVRAVWQAIAPQPALELPGATVSCSACGMVRPASEVRSPCPRCGHSLRQRKPDAVNRTAAFIVTGYLLIVPAYWFAISETVRPTEVKRRSILGGVSELFEAGYWYLGLVLLTASFLIPLLKLGGLTWLLVRLRYPAAPHLRWQTRAHRFIHVIGRWSNIDPLLAALTVALMSFPGLVQAHAGPAALPFTLVVVMTMLASRSFDSRLLWDVNGQSTGGRRHG